MIDPFNPNVSIIPNKTYLNITYPLLLKNIKNKSTISNKKKRRNNIKSLNQLFLTGPYPFISALELFKFCIPIGIGIGMLKFRTIC